MLLIFVKNVWGNLLADSSVASDFWTACETVRFMAATIAIARAAAIDD